MKTVENKTDAVLAKVEVQDKATVAHIQMIQKVALEIVAKHGEVAGKYMELCLYVRKNKISPKLVSVELGRIGFRRQRITEINRVANASDKLFSEYQAKLIGFDKCLELARVEVAGEKAVLTQAGKLLGDRNLISEQDAAEAERDEELPSDSGRAGSGPTTYEKIVKAMETILTLAPLLRKGKLPLSRKIAGFEIELIKTGKTAANV